VVISEAKIVARKPRTNANVLTAEIAIQPTVEGADHRHSIPKSDYPKRALGQKMPMIKKAPNAGLTTTNWP
jgi:hypothetical protein